jgi:hypothetical protein
LEGAVPDACIDAGCRVVIGWNLDALAAQLDRNVWDAVELSGINLQRQQAGVGVGKFLVNNFNVALPTDAVLQIDSAAISA